MLPRLLRHHPLEALIGVSLIVPLVLAIILAAQTRMMTDDFCTSATGRDAGLIEGYLIQYRTWSGQPLNVLIKNAVGILGSGSIPVLAALQFGILGVSLWYLLAQIDADRRIPTGWRLIGVLAGLLALFMLAPEPIQSFYWLAALVPYTLPLSLSAILIGLIARQARAGTPPTPVVIGGFGAISLIAAGFSESYLAAQLGALCAGLVLAGVVGWRRRALLPLFLVGLVLTGAMALFILSAPGNAVRRAIFPISPDPLKIVVDTIAVTHALLLILIVNFSPLAVALTVVTGFAIHLRFPVISRIAHPRRVLLAVYIFLLLTVGAFSGAGIYSTGYPPPSRTYVILAFFILVAAGIVGGVAGVLARGRFSARASLRMLTVVVVATAALSLIQSSQLLPILSAHARAWDERDSQIWRLSNDGVRHVVVPPLTVDLAAHDMLDTIGADPTGWVNGCAARYYRVETIAVDDSAVRATESAPSSPAEGNPGISTR